MTKIVYNGCYGGYGISYAAVMRYAELAGLKLYGFVSDYTNGRISFDKYIPLDPAKADKAFCIHWRKAPDMEAESWSDDELSRTDPLLVQVVEELGDRANGQCAKLRVAEIPDGGRYRIDEYDGYERVMPPDDYAWQTA